MLDAKRSTNYPYKSIKEISTTIKLGTNECTTNLHAVGLDLSQNYEQHQFEKQINVKCIIKLSYLKRDKNDAGFCIGNLL